ncbi:MAG: FAD-binding protein, partial [Clostridia bacterium]|nr:FAD-binding protein [Clostridia bacterium]
MKIFECDAVVVGTGCAGYNCADWLYDFGCKNILIVTEGVKVGTSRNTGSDKQTYYKLSLAGNDGDSVKSMAETLFAGGAMDGDLALTEAANSAKSFFKLVSLGVRFPMNAYGEYVGYKTDHDPFQRATSVGPYTSKMMTEALENSVLKKGIKILDGCAALRVLKDEEGVQGLLALDLTANDKTEYIAIKSPHVVLATGGPAG